MSGPLLTMFQDAFAGMSPARRVQPASQEEIDALAQQVATKAEVKAVADAMPLPAAQMPQPERTGAAKGAETQRYALEDHQHPRISSVSPILTLDANGMAVVSFNQAYDAEPSVLFTPIGSFGNTPPGFWVESYITNAQGKFIGANIKGVRAQNQTLASVSLAPLINVSVAGGSQTITPFGGPAAGIKVIATAVKQG